MKVVINKRYGGFSLSEEGMREYCTLKGCEWTPRTHVYEHNIPRDDPDLVAVVEKLGERSWGRYAKLIVIEIPDDLLWQVEEYDGMEHISEQHRTWGE